MARKFVSPGVFTQELDQSYIASGVGAIGAVVIGRTFKGPGLKPTLVTDINDFVAKFGDMDPTMQAPYAVKNYLKNSSACTVVRVLGDRSAATDPGITNAATYRSIGIVDADDTLLAVVNVLSGTDFTLVGTGSYPTFQFSGTTGDYQGVYAGTLSFLNTDPDYIGNVLNADPTLKGNFGHWLYQNFQWAGSGSGAPFATASLSSTLQNAFDCDFTSAKTPWIRSQNYGTSSLPLFRFHALSAGAASNTDVKVSIANIRKSTNIASTPYGTFDLVIRAFGDNDARLVQDETFTNVTLDPAAANYLPRVIGDQYRDWNSTTQKLVTYGTFKNYSRFIRVEMATAASAPADALPWQHDGYPQMIPNTTTINVPARTGSEDLYISAGQGVHIMTTPAGFTGVSKVVTIVSGNALSASLFGGILTITTQDGVTNTGDVRRLITTSGSGLTATLIGLSSTLWTGGPAWSTQSLGVDGIAASFFSGNVLDLSGAYVPDNLDSNNNVAGYTFFGLDFGLDGIGDLLKFHGRNSDTNPQGTIATPAGTAFSMHHLTTATLSGATYYKYDPAATYAVFPGVPSTGTINGFTVAFYGGFDGFDETQVDPLAPQGSTAISTVSLKKAIDLVSNPDEIDINLLAIPGITSQPVTSYAEQMCNSRADVMYVMDVSGSSVSQIIQNVDSRGIDDNYSACYYPYLRYADTTNNVLVTVAPSVAVLGAIAYNDRVGQVFFAPAGLNRGGLSQFGIVDTVDRLTFQDRNDLYESRINPIATFPNEGIVIWGQKTLQVKASALDRVNVRRLLIYAKKTIASVARYLLFEPNNPQTWQKFINTVNPILEKVRMDQGLERFKVVMDKTVNTPDLIDRNIMTGKIFLQPTRTAEYIDLSFIITASGVQFEE
jgi:hypothetical protein